MSYTTIHLNDLGGVNLLNPNLDSVSLQDIALALSRTYRFSGKAFKIFTVAGHSTTVGLLAEAFDEPEDTIRAAIVHDFTEAFISDVPTPVKNAIPEIRELENTITTEIQKKFCIKPDHEKVKLYDHMALLYESTLLTDLADLHAECGDFEATYPEVFKKVVKVYTYVMQNPLSEFEQLLNICKEYGIK